MPRSYSGLSIPARKFVVLGWAHTELHKHSNYVFIDTPLGDVATWLFFFLSAMLFWFQYGTCTILKQLLRGSLEAVEKALLWELEDLGQTVLWPNKTLSNVNWLPLL